MRPQEQFPGLRPDRTVCTILPKVLPGMPAQELAPNFRPIMTAYYDALMALGMRLMRTLALTLDLPRDWFVDRFEKPLGSLRPLHYDGRISQPDDVRGPPSQTQTPPATLTISASRSRSLPCPPLW